MPGKPYQIYKVTSFVFSQQNKCSKDFFLYTSQSHLYLKR